MVLRRGLAAILVLAVAGLAGAAVFGRSLSVPRYRGPRSDHFDGERFFNPNLEDQHGLADFLRWRLNRDQGLWSRHEDAEPGPPPPAKVEGATLRVTFVNHATVLLQSQGVNILTDPIWSERPSPVPWAGPRRMRPPGLRFTDLPPIDAVLLSHNHYDHTDLPTLRRLVRAHAPRIFCGLGMREYLEVRGVAPVTELDWWEEAALTPQVAVRAVPVQHFSSRSPSDRNRSLWTGYSIATPAGDIYFAGDTGAGPHFRAVRERLGPPRLALLPIGAYLPRWFMAPVHISPAEAVAAHRELEAATSVAIHFGTWALGDDAETQPAIDLAAALAAEPAARPFWILGFGEGREVHAGSVNSSGERVRSGAAASPQAPRSAHP